MFKLMGEKHLNAIGSRKISTNHVTFEVILICISVFYFVLYVAHTTKK